MNNEGFIPRARARGHARTLRARALYGMANRCNMCPQPLLRRLVGGIGPWALGPKGYACTAHVSPCSAWGGPSIAGPLFQG